VVPSVYRVIKGWELQHQGRWRARQHG
jgi:hypothetical protein